MEKDLSKITVKEVLKGNPTGLVMAESIGIPDTLARVAWDAMVMCGAVSWVYMLASAVEHAISAALLRRLLCDAMLEMPEFADNKYRPTVMLIKNFLDGKRGVTAHELLKRNSQLRFEMSTLVDNDHAKELSIYDLLTLATDTDDWLTVDNVFRKTILFKHPVTSGDRFNVVKMRDELVHASRKMFKYVPNPFATIVDADNVSTPQSAASQAQKTADTIFMFGLADTPANQKPEDSIAETPESDPVTDTVKTAKSDQKPANQNNLITVDELINDYAPADVKFWLDSLIAEGHDSVNKLLKVLNSGLDKFHRMLKTHGIDINDLNLPAHSENYLDRDVPTSISIVGTDSFIRDSVDLLLAKADKQKLDHDEDIVRVELKYRTIHVVVPTKEAAEFVNMLKNTLDLEAVAGNARTVLSCLFDGDDVGALFSGIKVIRCNLAKITKAHEVIVYWLCSGRPRRACLLTGLTDLYVFTKPYSVVEIDASPKWYASILKRTSKPRYAYAKVYSLLKFLRKLINNGGDEDKLAILFKAKYSSLSTKRKVFAKALLRCLDLRLPQTSKIRLEGQIDKYKRIRAVNVFNAENDELICTVDSNV